ncbi:MAG: polysaccharide lyase, partial [Verrucomicrobiaceae bacterium]|nr:polysaccharide lyase [Verrucomicrobiaceae bacterium]
GTAIAGTNYIAAPATLTIPAGATSVPYPISILGTAMQRHAATFTVTVADVTHATGPGPASGIIVPLDTDGDGMPDFWEVAHNLDPNDAADAAVDGDSDGVSNHDEYQFGTDPYSAASRFSVASPQVKPGGGMVIRFNTGLDRTYRVEFKDNLNDPVWLPLGAVISGTGSTVEVTDPVSVALTPARFYHVRVLP